MSNAMSWKKKLIGGADDDVPQCFVKKYRNSFDLLKSSAILSLDHKEAKMKHREGYDGW